MVRHKVTVPICPLIKWSSISMLHVNITFSPILSSKECAKLQVTLRFAFIINSKSVSQNTKLIGNSYMALIKIHSVLSGLIIHLFRASAGAFSANKCKASIGYEISFCTATLDF